MTTSYDLVWETFLNNCKVSDIDVPQIPEQIYEAIKNGIMHFNNRLRENIVWDDLNEVLDRDLSNDHLLILAHYIRLIFLRNQKTYYEALWQPFAKDVGLKNFGTQLKSLENSITNQERTIDSLIMNMEVDFL